MCSDPPTLNQNVNRNFYCADYTLIHLTGIVIVRTIHYKDTMTRHQARYKPVDPAIQFQVTPASEVETPFRGLHTEGVFPAGERLMYDSDGGRRV